MESRSRWRQQWSNNVVKLNVLKGNRDGRNAQYRAQKDISLLTLDSVQKLDMERIRHTRFAKFICNRTLTCLILIRSVVNCLQGNFKAGAELCEILSSIRDKSSIICATSVSISPSFTTMSIDHASPLEHFPFKPSLLRRYTMCVFLEEKVQFSSFLISASFFPDD